MAASSTLIGQRMWRETKNERCGYVQSIYYSECEQDAQKLHLRKRTATTWRKHGDVRNNPVHKIDKNRDFINYQIMLGIRGQWNMRTPTDNSESGSGDGCRLMPGADLVKKQMSEPTNTTNFEANLCQLNRQRVLTSTTLKRFTTIIKFSDRKWSRRMGLQKRSMF